MALVYKTINLWAFRDNNIHILCFSNENLGKEIRFKLLNSDGTTVTLDKSVAINFYWTPDGSDASYYISGSIANANDGTVAIPITKEICSTQGRISCVLEINKGGDTTKFGSIEIDVINGIGDVEASILNPAQYDLVMSMQGDVTLLKKKLEELAKNNDPNAEIVEAKGISSTLKKKISNYDTFAMFPNQTVNIMKNNKNFENTDNWDFVNTGELSATGYSLKAVSEDNFGIYGTLEKDVPLTYNKTILVKARVRCLSGTSCTVTPCWRKSKNGALIPPEYISAGNMDTSTSNSSVSWNLPTGKLWRDIWFIGFDGGSTTTINQIGLFVTSGTTIEISHFEVYYSEDDIKTNLSTLANNDYVEYNCTPELVKYRYFNGTMVETTGYTSALFKLPPDTKRVKITMSTIINAHKYTFIDSSGAILKYGVSMYTSESDAVFYVDVPKDAYACICSNNASLCSSITLTALKNNVKDTFNDITQKSNTTLLSANLYINGDKWTDGFLDNWFSRMNAVGVKNITLVVTPIMGNDGNFKLRQNEFELLDRYIAKYQFNIATIKFSNKLIASGRFSDYQQDFGNEEIRTKYINFVEATLKKLVYAYPTIEKCFAINEAAYWYRPTNGDYTSQKMYMCQSIINKCNAIVPTGISFAGFWDYLTCSNGVVPLLKKYGVIGINHYQPLTADINRTMIPTAIDSYDTWKNQIVKAGFERLKNDGFTNICISETGICDFIESMYDVFAESTGTTANGEVQAIYWDGLLRLIKNDCPYVSDISMWYAEYLNSSSDKVVSVFRKWFNGGVSNG